MFASYEVATSFPSLTAIKGYDLDKSSDVPLMGHINEMLTDKHCTQSAVNTGWETKAVVQMID